MKKLNQKWLLWKCRNEISKGTGIPKKDLFGKPESDGLYDSLIEEVEKEQNKRLKHTQKHVGKMIMEIVEKKYPELKGKFKVVWDEIE